MCEIKLPVSYIKRKTTCGKARDFKGVVGETWCGKTEDLVGYQSKADLSEEDGLRSKD